MKSRLLATGAVLLLTACNQVIGARDRYVRRAVDREEIIGRWVLAPDSDRYEATKRGMFQIDTGRLTLAGDGTCRVEPVTAGGPGTSEQPAKPTDAKELCTWKLDKAKTYVWHQEREVPAVLLRLEHRVGTHSKIELLTLYIYEQRGALILWDWADDPDYPKYVSLKKGGEEGP